MAEKRAGHRRNRHNKSAHGGAGNPQKVKVKVLIVQLYSILCNSMDYSPPDSSVHGILQAGILEWVAITFCRGIFPTQGSNPSLPLCRQILYCLSHQGSHRRGSSCCSRSRGLDVLGDKGSDNDKGHKNRCAVYPCKQGILSIYIAFSVSWCLWFA